MQRYMYTVAEKRKDKRLEVDRYEFLVYRLLRNALELLSRLAPSAKPNRRSCIGAAPSRLSMNGQDHAGSSGFMPGQ